MASKVEQQYKLLNAELMDQVQKQRIEIGAYRTQVIALKHENMELREASILSNARRRQEHIGILRTLMRRLEIDSDCLADKTLTTEQEPEPELESPIVLKRRSQQRRSSKQICQEMRRSSELVCSIKTISPTRHRDTKADEPKEAPKLTHTPPPRRIAEMTDGFSSEDEIINVTSIDEEEQPLMETVRDQLAGQKEQEPPAEKTLQEPPAEVTEQQLSSEEKQRQIQELSSEEENSHSEDRLDSILEDSDEETTESSYSFSSPFSCDSTVEEFTLPRRPPLRSVDPNVLPVRGSSIITRGMSKSTQSFSIDKDNSVEEQPSIQVPRLLVTRPSQSPCKSLLNSLASASQLSPRCSRFEGDFQMSGSNTSTPKANQPPKKTAKELGESTRRYVKSKERARNQTTEPRGLEQTADLSTSMCPSATGRPSRKCRPTQLAEPSLRDKMRNSSVGKKRI